MSRLPDNTFSDRHLVEKVLSGDARAFTAIIHNTERLVAQLVIKMVSNTSDHPDLVQDIYLKAFKGLSSFKFHAKLSTWIGQITYNTCLNYLEKKKLVLVEDSADPEDTVPGITLDRLQYEQQGLPTNETESQLSGKERSALLQSAIDKLPPVYKTLVTLYHQEELSYGEIVQITSLPEGTIKSYLFRARKALKETLLSGYKREEL